MERETAIKTENVSVIYDQGRPSETKALTDINVVIYKEDFAVIFGPSGCGKSTMLYAISGIEKPTRGSVFVNEKDITKFAPLESAKFHRSDIGMVFQAYNLIPTLTVVDNVALPQVFRGVSKEKRTLRAKILLQRFGILPQAEKLPTELSGGQQQRVGIARALINEQPIIFADEPVGNLDSKSAKIVLDILYDLNLKDKKTVILVTHDPSLLRYATHIIYMKDGIIVGEKRFTPEQRNNMVNFQSEQPFILSPSELGSRSITAGNIETSAAEKNIQREEEAKKLVASLQQPQQEAAEKPHPIAAPISATTIDDKETIDTEPRPEIKSESKPKELTIGELITQKQHIKK